MKDPEDSNNDWTDVQRKYWEQWTEMTQKAIGKEAESKNPWENAIDHWWLSVAPMTPDPAKAFMEKMIGQGKIFYNMAEAFSQSLQQAENKAEWDEALDATLDRLKQAFDPDNTGEIDQDLNKLMAFWEMPLESWQRIAGSISGLPPILDENLEKYLSTPGLGFTREAQEQQKEMVRKAKDYQQALATYSQFFGRLGQQSVERLREVIKAMDADDDVIDSAKGLYDLWIKVSEDVYSEQVMTSEYAKLHGELVNALMGVKKQSGIMTDEILVAMNIPTRRDLRQLQDKMQDLKRENRVLRNELDSLKREPKKPAKKVRSRVVKKAATKSKRVVTKKTARVGKGTVKKTKPKN